MPFLVLDILEQVFNITNSLNQYSLRVSHLTCASRFQPARQVRLIVSVP